MGREELMVNYHYLGFGGVILVLNFQNLKIKEIGDPK